MKDKGVITREGKGRVEGRLPLIEKHPELGNLVKKYKNKTFRMSDSKIYKILEIDHGIKIHRTSVPNILKDIELKKKEERNRKRRKSNLTVPSS